MIPNLPLTSFYLLVILHCRAFAQQILQPNNVPRQSFVPRLLRQPPQPSPVTIVRPQPVQQVTTTDAQRRLPVVLRPGFAWVSRKKLEAMKRSAERGHPGGDHERADLKQLDERRRRRLLLRKLIDPAVEEAISDPRFAVRNRPAEIPPQPSPAFRPPQPQTQFRPPTIRQSPQVQSPPRPSQPAPRPPPAVTVLTARQSPVNNQNRPPQPQGPPPQARPTPPPPKQRLRAPPPQHFAPQNVNNAAGIDRRTGVPAQPPSRSPSPKSPPPPQSVQVAPPKQLQRSESPRTSSQIAQSPPRQPAPPSQQVPPATERPLTTLTQPTPPPRTTSPPAPPPLQSRPSPTPPPSIQLSQSADQISRNSVAAPAPNSPSPPAETQPKPSSGKTGPHPPGFLPPSNSVIEQLNGADNFMDVAERLQLKRLLINRSRRHTEFVVHRQQIMLASTPTPFVPKIIVNPEIPDRFSSIPVKNITKTVWRMPLTMTLQQKLTIMPKDKEKLVV